MGDIDSRSAWSLTPWMRRVSCLTAPYSPAPRSAQPCQKCWICHFPAFWQHSRQRANRRSHARRSWSIPTLGRPCAPDRPPRHGVDDSSIATAPLDNGSPIAVVVAAALISASRSATAGVRVSSYLLCNAAKQRVTLSSCSPLREHVPALARVAAAPVNQNNWPLMFVRRRPPCHTAQLLGRLIIGCSSCTCACDACCMPRRSCCRQTARSRAHGCSSRPIAPTRQRKRQPPAPGNGSGAKAPRNPCTGAFLGPNEKRRAVGGRYHGPHSNPASRRSSRLSAVTSRGNTGRCVQRPSLRMPSSPERPLGPPRPAAAGFFAGRMRALTAGERGCAAICP